MDIYTKTGNTGGLATKDRLVKWEINVSLQCPLCNEAESIHHLLFQCPETSSIWLKLLRWQKMQRDIMDGKRR